MEKINVLSWGHGLQLVMGLVSVREMDPIKQIFYLFYLTIQSFLRQYWDFLSKLFSVKQWFITFSFSWSWKTLWDWEQENDSLSGSQYLWNVLLEERYHCYDHIFLQVIVSNEWVTLSTVSSALVCPSISTTNARQDVAHSISFSRRFVILMIQSTYLATSVYRPG